jgi:MFS transporter, PPP family, 3-phenylpropionic acid transporter
MVTKKQDRYFFIFLSLYAFSYMCNAVYSTFIPIYLTSVGYNKTNIGILLSLAPIVAIIGQPLWGTFSDRAKTKNMVLKILILGSAFSVLFYRVSSSFFYLSFIITCFTFFQTSINPMSDAITLEYSQISKWKFGHIRLAGTIGYSLMAVLAGILLMKNLNRMFVIYFTLGILTFVAAVLLPKVKGHQSEGKKLAVWRVFQDRTLVLYILFALIIQITLGFYYTFFSIYYQQLGASRSLIGWGSFASGISEIPFLLFAHIILKKAKTHHALLFAGTAASLRWLLLGVVVNPYMVLLLQGMHGMIFIVISVSLATYINNSVPKELKASGQALSAVFGTGVARVIGSLFGGYLSDMFGIRRMFINNSIFAFAAVIAFAVIFSRMTTNKKDF